MKVSLHPAQGAAKPRFSRRNRLVEVKNTGGAVVATYRYDGANRRVTFYDGTNTRHYYYSDQWQVLEERENSGSTYDQYFTWGLRYIDDLIKRTGGRAHHYALADYFSITSLLSTSGTVIERYTYDAFGKPSYWTSGWSTRASSSYDWETLYGSYRYDLESGLYQVRNRYLHPNLGRWISRDSIGKVGFEITQDGGEFDPEGDGTNLYAYVHNNAVNAVDFYGLLCGGKKLGRRQKCCGGEVISAGPNSPCCVDAGGNRVPSVALYERDWNNSLSGCIGTYTQIPSVAGVGSGRGIRLIGGATKCVRIVGDVILAATNLDWWFARGVCVRRVCSTGSQQR